MTEDVFDGDALRAARIQAGLSQRDLAEKAGVSPTVIKYLEGGKRDPQRTTAECLARALGVSVDQLKLRTPAPQDAA